MFGKLNFSNEEEILKFISENNIKILNLCHIPEEGRMKTLSFSAADRDRVLEILEFGERVDGSSLFSLIEPAKSDIYIVPEIRKSFVNPFATPSTLNVLCNYLDENGNLLDIAPSTVLARAEKKLFSSNGIVLKALAELEYYIIAKQQDEMLFIEAPDKNYHESSPFAKFENLRNEILAMLNIVGIPTKYGHSEVGRIISKDNAFMEQHEIEFASQNLTEMAETIAIAKWIIRNICAMRGVCVTFIPKISLDHAGNGMHIHLCALKRNKNVVANPDGTLSDEAKEIIGGILKFAPSLAAFGNPTPLSYLRFIARKESPNQICWSARNRLALIRIPLWWNFKEKRGKEENCRETFEYRAPDAFANAYLLFAGIALAANYGLDNPKEALKIAQNLKVEAATKEEKKLKVLPRSCSESAENLEKDRQIYETDGIFPKILIDKTIEKLKAYNDSNLWSEPSTNAEKIDKIYVQWINYG